MVLIELADGTHFLYDCNVTEENADRVLQYMADQIGWGAKIGKFACSHRDADHMRGVKRIHEYFPIQKVWDTGVTGTSPESWEYRDFMDLRRKVGFLEVEHLKRWDFGNTRLRVMNSKNDKLANNANAQSMVIKVVHRNSAADQDHDSVMLTGDTDAATWKTIRNNYADADLACSLLMGSHHGSLTYFDDPVDEKHYYIDHVIKKAPAMAILSVGDNPHGHPHAKSLELYEKHCSGSDKGNKLARTDVHGTIIVTLKDGGGWNVKKSRA